MAGAYGKGGSPHVPWACVLGDMDLVRPLGMAGIPVVAVGPPGATPRFSRFVSGALDWCGNDRDTDELTQVLISFAARCDEPPVLFFQNDAEVLYASRQRDRLDPAIALPLADRDVVEELIDKSRFGALAARRGLPVPAERVLRTAADAEVDGLAFPVIVKPLSRGSGAWARLGVEGKAIRVDSEEELRSVWPLLRELGPSVVAQEYVPGDEDRIESYHCYVDAGGTVLGEFTGRKIRTRPRRYGFTTALEITARGDVRELGRHVIDTLGVRGVAKVDLKRAPDDSLRLLEINPRFNLWHHPGAVAGVNLPALAHADLTGRAYPRPGPARPGVRWCNAIDAAAAREDGIPLRTWLGWAARCQARAHLTPDDPGAVLGRAAWRLLHTLGRRR